jgi:hypothetical protein
MNGDVDSDVGGEVSSNALVRGECDVKGDVKGAVMGEQCEGRQRPDDAANGDRRGDGDGMARRMAM